MRKIVNSTFVTLDGVVNHMDTWHFDFVDADSDALALEQLTEADAMLMGRRSYEVYAGAWPGRDGEYAARINALPKYVASTTLTDPTWENTEVLTGSLTDEVRRLKSSDGGSILMHGFGPVAKTLLAEGLLDELHLWYHPSFAGVGTADDRLHTEGLTAHLQYAGAKPLASGVVVLSYTAGGAK
ncbi:dihydrofolate reductase family protein [Kribbella italica]|uniref:Dihydrofolate reductase n=1 Tax=Kribbella italica TaxID=1540520 RepID=A0A7W9JC34_9ACTN|nr:dihydrofolate reductase family protein [Kribbella italica]MBB5838693.1 dihydrofolate reductase [Kribbella italica]